MSFGIVEGDSDPFTDFGTAGGNWDDWYNGSDTTASDSDSITSMFDGFDFGSVLESVATYGLVDLFDIDTSSQPVYDSSGRLIPASYQPATTATATKTNWVPLVVGALVVMVLLILIMKLA